MSSSKPSPCPASCHSRVHRSTPAIVPDHALSIQNRQPTSVTSDQNAVPAEPRHARAIASISRRANGSWPTTIWLSAAALSARATRWSSPTSSASSAPFMVKCSARNVSE